VLSLGYLLALRAGAVAPSFVPLLVLAAFPVAAALVSARDRAVSGSRRTVLAVAVVELLWTVLGQAIVGFAIASRSG
jgi:hypothetical protein